MHRHALTPRPLPGVTLSDMARLCLIVAALGAPAVCRAQTADAKPLLVGNWADPAVLKDGPDYYMTHSSFDYQPGLLIWHSRDLRRWLPVTHAVVNQPGSVWAPELVKHRGRYFLYYPADGKNWVTTADRPQGPWSAPQDVGVGRIDPGHVVGPDGTRYLHLSGGGAVTLDAGGLKAVSPIRKVYDGWPIPADWAVECFCLESPKLMWRDGWYYLTSAQGGTAGPSTSHMVVSARSRTPLGPWENSPHNPVIRTRSRDEPWWSKGHGTPVEGPDGHWYCVLHGWRNGHRTLGRATLIEPLVWTEDGWFKAADRWPAGWDGPAHADLPLGDTFDGPALGIQWQFYRHFDPERFRLAGGSLRLKAFGQTPGASRPLTVMPMHPRYEVEAEVEVEANATAGLLLFASPDVHIGLALAGDGRLTRAQSGFRVYRNTDEPATGRARLTLRIVNDAQDVRFYYRDAAGAWRILQPSVDVSAAHHNAVGDWHALRPALFCCGDGEARFHSFRYQELPR